MGERGMKTYNDGGVTLQAAFEEAIQEAPVIAAVKNDMGLAHALRSECAAVFILYGTILDIGQIVKRIKAAGKLAFVHADLIEGLSNRGEIAVDFLAEATKADGIISTRPNLIHHAKELGLIEVPGLDYASSNSAAAAADNAGGGSWFKRLLGKKEGDNVSPLKLGTGKGVTSGPS